MKRDRVSPARVPESDDAAAAVSASDRTPPRDRPDAGWSGIRAVQEMIRQNDAERRAKKRMSWSELLNHAWCTLGGAAVRGGDAASQADAVRDVFALLDEFARGQRVLPRSTSLAMVLHQWCEHGRVDDGVRLVNALLACQSDVPEAAFTAAFDERVATVACRLYARSRHATQSQLLDLLQLLPPDALKRRLLRPLLEYAASKDDVALARRVLDVAATRAIELWDADFNQVLRAMVQSWQHERLPRATAVAYVEEVLRIMSVQQPVVGADNAALLQRLLGGAVTTVTEQEGRCGRCGGLLQSYDLSDDDRRALLEDILHKLVRPRMTLAADTAATPSAADVAAHEEAFARFTRTLAALRYDTVIDGANVGYYGLSSWYREAKEALLRDRGVDPADVPLAERVAAPLPVDVAPKFALIEEMRQAALRLGRRPIIVLHERHLQTPPTENADVLAAWRAAQALLPSPHFLNDDFCWLYAAVAQAGAMVVTNDQMRDHHFSMLQPRFFVRWRQRHRIGYKAMYHHASRTVTLALRTPRRYSVWVQAAAATHWHVPFLAAVPVLQQATNQLAATPDAVELSKDGDDACTAWLCTSQTAVKNDDDACRPVPSSC